MISVYGITTKKHFLESCECENFSLIIVSRRIQDFSKNDVPTRARSHGKNHNFLAEMFQILYAKHNF